MKIKDYTCECGHNDFFFIDKGNQKGIYCTNCGKWLKWANKDEQNLAMKQEPEIGHWIHLRSDMYECSECGKIYTSFEIGKCDADYCPKCGAKMESEEE